jgi:2-amino-4-hydroxy-6-hydroxymethyldihydropteridine diphosphokinase
MIIIGLGSNVTSRYGNSDTTIHAAFGELERAGIKVLRHSRLYRTQPYGLSSQPNFTNAAAVISTSYPPDALLSLLKRIERKAGRRSSERWGPRALDLDIIDYNKRILNWSQPNRQIKSTISALILPHPGAALRPFVLQPILDIAPFWHHPVSGLTASQLLIRIGRAKMGRIIEPIWE